jgi:hypothetical protein
MPREPFVRLGQDQIFPVSRCRASIDREGIAPGFARGGRFCEVGMTTIMTIIQRTPIWVFPLIGMVLWLGVINLRKREVSLILIGGGALLGGVMVGRYGRLGICYRQHAATPIRPLS